MVEPLTVERDRYRQWAAEDRALAKATRARARFYLMGGDTWTVRGMRRAVHHGRMLRRQAMQLDVQAKRWTRAAKRETRIIGACRALGIVDRCFTLEELRAAYKRRAYELHPDRVRGVRSKLAATKRMARVNAGHQVLLALLRGDKWIDLDVRQVRAPELPRRQA